MALSSVLLGCFPDLRAAGVVIGWEPAERVTAAGGGLPLAWPRCASRCHHQWGWCILSNLCDIGEHGRRFSCAQFLHWQACPSHPPPGQHDHPRMGQYLFEGATAVAPSKALAPPSQWYELGAVCDG